MSRVVQGPVLAWHFLAEGGPLREPTSDTKGILHEYAKVGITLRAKGRLVLCHNGLHGSILALDALRWAPGPWVERVRMDGRILDGRDKLDARLRTTLWIADATPVLQEFACLSADRMLLGEREAGREPDPRSWAAVETKRRWLRGAATDEELSAAASAARSAAENVARSPARSPAWNAARSAAVSAARSPARSPAWKAAWNAAVSAAWIAAVSELNGDLERLLLALAPAEAQR